MRMKQVTGLLAGMLLGLGVVAAQAQTPTDSGAFVHFVPNLQSFWDFSKHWSTNYGPNYRDTVVAPANFLQCSGMFALCASSGPAPLSCTLSPDGRFANCRCPVHSGTNYVVITSILNYKVYQATVKKCGPDGRLCAASPAGTAPVCQAIKEGRLIPGADVISTFSPGNAAAVAESQLLAPASSSNVTMCPKGPYAGCMTAPCKMTSGGYARCSCPVFWGPFQVPEPNAVCTLANDQVWSGSYDPSGASPP
jgi:hypothetical protein